MRIREEKGFTLIEVIVVAAIIAVLAGIIVPLVFKEVDESKISKAKADLKTIQTAIMMFYKDNQKWPKYENDGGTLVESVTLLRTDGGLPNDIDAYFDTTLIKMLKNHLIENGVGYDSRWKGPYINEANPDPWGNSYIIDVASLGTPNPVWILSAGPNGKVETPRNAQSVQGDDIGIRLQ
ncbi:MAG: type II secretion system protein GspG [Proteobacteria bacterium]|nr:type II secretion system protein GspG [Pseudomonadota bacterium]